MHLPRLRLHQSHGHPGIFRCVAGRAFQHDTGGVDPQRHPSVVHHLRRIVGGLVAAQTRRSAGVDQPRLRETPGQHDPGNQPLARLVDLHVAPAAIGVDILIPAENDDVVHPLNRRMGKILAFKPP